MKTALCALVVAGSLAGAAKADFQMIGAGIVSCGTWTADRQYPGSADALQDEQWVVGFLSGVGFISEQAADPLSGMDAQGVWAWIHSYCRLHPIEKVESAALHFYYFHPR